MMHVAVVGSGIAGLSAAYLLSRRHRVSLFERDTRLGGHTHTVLVEHRGGTLALDTGFLVHNPRTYPNLVRLFGDLGVETQPSDMSFSVSCASSGLEYSSRGLGGFFAQRRRLLTPAHHRLLWQIARFNRIAPAVLDSDAGDELTLGDFLRERRFDGLFLERYLLPMTSAIWSASAADVERFPAATIVRFLHNHGMLSLGAHPLWRVVKGGSASYVPKLAAPLGADVHTAAAIVAVRRAAGHVCITFADGRSMTFDHVVFACHGDQVLPLLADATDCERAIFSRFTTTANEAWLHTDASLLPASPAARASWNYRLGDRAAAPQVTYHLNRLQGLQSAADYCVTLNPVTPPAAAAVIRRITYRHPQLDAAAIGAQRRWAEVSGIGRTHYCGAYWRYGFHEDGLWSAIRVARQLGAEW
jgi:uncharacterized protein